MSVKTNVELKAQIDADIKANGNREITPAKHNSIESNINDSMLNIKDGGNVVQALTGYATDLVPSDNKHFASKGYVDLELGSCLLLDGSTPMTSNIVFDNEGNGITNDDGTAYVKFGVSNSIALVSDGDVGIDSNTVGIFGATSVFLDGGVSASTIYLESSGITITATNIDLVASGDFTINGDIVATQAYADSLVVGLWDDRGTFNASVNAYPSSGGSGSAGAIKKGDIWQVSVAGTLPTGQAVEVGDTVRALIDTPGNTQANWGIIQNNIGYVTAQDSLVVHLSGSENITGSKTFANKILFADTKGIDVANNGDTLNVGTVDAATINMSHTGGSTTIAGEVNFPNRVVMGTGYAVSKTLETWATGSAHTGTIVETTLRTIAVPALMMGANSILMITYVASCTNNGNVKTLRIKVGSTNFSSVALTGGAGGTKTFRVYNRGAVNSQVFPNTSSASGAGAIGSATASIDFSTSQSILITAELANTGDTITLESYEISIINPGI